MTTILRVKRKNTDVPQGTLVIACKRPKTEASSSDISTVETVVQFAGTIVDPTEDVTQHINKILPQINAESDKIGTKRQRVFSDYPSNIPDKISKRINEESKRYKITDCQQSSTSNEEESKETRMTLIDVEDCWSTSQPTNQQTVKKEDIKDFVYDLYYAQRCDDIWFENDNILVRQLEYQNEENEEQCESSDDSSDSNAESHWKNDYPDTEYSCSDDSNDSDENELYDVIITNHPRRRRRELENYFDDELSDDNNTSDLGEETYDHMMKLGIEEESADEQTSD